MLAQLHKPRHSQVSGLDLHDAAENDMTMTACPLQNQAVVSIVLTSTGDGDLAQPTCCCKAINTDCRVTAGLLTPEVAAADVVAGVVAGMPAGMFAGMSAGVWADAFGAVLDVGRVVLPVALPGCKSSAN